MYFYINIPTGPRGDKRGTTVTVSGITLKDGYIPTISGQVLSVKADDGSPILLEPAIWFKVLVLDSIYMDCTSNKRAVMWNTAVLPDVRGFEDSVTSISSTASNDTLRLTRRNSKVRNRISESLYLGGEFYGLANDIYDAFEIAQKAANEYTKQLIKPMEFYETVLRILHCYILPAIELTQDEVPKLTVAYALQQKMVEKVDDRIRCENCKAEEVAGAKRRQRRNFAEELSALVNSGSRPSYPMEFSKLLYRDIQQDIAECWESVDDQQTEVDRAKQLVSTNPTKENKKLLEDCRAKRDRGHLRHTQLLKVREILHEMTHSTSATGDPSGRKKSRKSKRKSVHANKQLTAIYMELEKTYDQLMENLMRITGEKVLALSVKEAMKETLGELVKGEETAGMDVNCTALRRPTDVLRHSSIPKQWKTFPEQVASVILDPDHDLCVIHDQFCKEIIEKCKKASARLDGCDKAAKSRESLPRDIKIKAGSSDTRVKHTSLDSVQNSNIQHESEPLLNRSPLFRENQLYCCMDKGTVVEQDGNRNDIDQNFHRKGDSSVYMDYQPTDGRDSTLSSLTDGQCACFGRMSIASQKGTYLPQNTEDFKQPAKAAVPKNVHESYSSSHDQMEIVPGANRDQAHSKIVMTEIKTSIANHIEDMVSQLEKEIYGSSSDQLHRKIWSCYESHFYERVMSYLIGFYEASYRDITIKFCESLCELTVKDLSMENSFVLHLLVDKDTKPFESSMELDSESIPSSVDSNCGKFVCSSSPDMVEMMPLSNSHQCQSSFPSDAYIPNILSLRMEEISTVRETSKVRTTATNNNVIEDCADTSQGNELIPKETNCEKKDGSQGNSGVPLMRNSVRNGVGQSNARRTQDSWKRLTRCNFTDFEKDETTNANFEEAKKSMRLGPILEQNGDSSSTGSGSGSGSGGGSSEYLSKTSSESSSSSETLNSQGCPVLAGSDRGSILSNKLSIFTENYNASDKGDIKVCVPCLSSTTSMHDRNTWPMLGNPPSDCNEKSGEQSQRKRCKRPLPSPSSKDHLILQGRYKQLSQEAMKCVHSVIKETSPLTKLQFLTKCLRELSEDIRDISEELEGDPDAASADKQLDYLIVFLCNCDPKIVSKLYVNVSLLNDILPYFLESGPFAYSLVQFQMAISFLNERIVFLSRAVTTSSSTSSSC